MSLARFQAVNHPQQVGERGPVDDIDDRATPLEWFRLLNQRFAFTVDAAAAEHNAKLPRFFDKTQNGLEQPWDGERVWCNPPFSDIRPWVEKAWASKGSPLCVVLVPANRTEQAWWHELVEAFRDRPGSPLRVEFVRHRQRFIKAGDHSVKANDRPPFGVCLLIWERI